MDEKQTRIEKVLLNNGEVLEIELEEDEEVYFDLIEGQTPELKKRKKTKPQE